MQPGEALLHRRVALLARGVPVSEADLWYVPDRLPAAMAQALAETDSPFGTVVAPLRPGRETLRLRVCDGPEPIWLEIEALLRDGRGTPIALVHERYLRGACTLLGSLHCNTSSPSRIR
jgi:chorismate-pyruvate lyase